MNKMRISTKRYYKTPPNRSHTAEEYSNRTEKYNRLNIRLDEAEKSVNLKTALELIQSEQQKEKNEIEWR